MISEIVFDDLLAPDDNSILNATYHDVHIKQVQIINPNSTTVKFQEQHDRKPDYYKEAQQTRFLAQQLMTDPVPQEDVRFLSLNDPAPNSAGKDISNQKQDGMDHISPVHIVNVPLAPNQRPSSREAPRTASRALPREQSKELEVRRQRHKEELMIKKQQIIQSLTSLARRGSGRQRRPHPQFYEVSPGVVIPERPLSRYNGDQSPDQHNVVYQEKNYNVQQQTRLMSTNTRSSKMCSRATVPRSSKGRLWRNHRSAGSRAGSRALSSVSSSRWRAEEPLPAKPNLFVKMPFKQVPALTMDVNYKPEDDLVLAGEEMRATTAFTLSRIRHAIGRMPDPTRLDSRQGRLLKAKLKPMMPVKHNQPGIWNCRGIQPENRKQGYSPSPSRQRHLKEQYLEACKMHEKTPSVGDRLGNEYERRMNAHSTTPDHESVHRTSPQPAEDPDFLREDAVFQAGGDLQPDPFLTSIREHDETHNHHGNEGGRGDEDDYSRFSRRKGDWPLDRYMKDMHLESGVIF